MSYRVCIIIYLTALVCIVPGRCLAAEVSVLDAYRQQAFGLSEKRVEQKIWSDNQKSDLMQHSFPLQRWDLHYSSLGTQKSGIVLEEATAKKRFNSEIITFPSKERTLSNWNSRLADLERQAQISTDQTMRKIEEKRLYRMMLQTSPRYSDTGDMLSLREINRFQFRKNHSDAVVPVQEVGMGDDS